MSADPRWDPHLREECPATLDGIARVDAEWAAEEAAERAQAGEEYRARLDDLREDNAPMHRHYTAHHGAMRRLRLARRGEVDERAAGLDAAHERMMKRIKEAT